MEYIAYGGVITNRLLYTDKTCIQDIMGGSGFYTMEGRAIIVEDTDIGHFDPASNTITISDSTVNIVLKHK